MVFLTFLGEQVSGKRLVLSIIADRQTLSELRNLLSFRIKSSFKSLLLFYLASLLLGCFSPEKTEWVYHKDWSTEVRFVEWPDVRTRGLGVGFVRPEHRDLHPRKRPSTHTFYLQEGEPFTPLLILSVGYERPYPVLVSVFLDYKQVPFVLDGQEGLLHYLEIPPLVDIEIPLTVPVSTPGWHDFFVVVFPQPDYHPTEPAERLPPKLGVGGRRTVICAGNCRKPIQTLPSVFVGQEVNIRTLVVDAFPLLPNDGRPPQHRLLLTVTGKPGEILPLELWARNPSDQTKEYVVIPLLDFQQITFAGSDVLHLHMPPRSELFIPGEIQLPTAEGIHELQFISIFDPYRDLDEITDPFVQSAMRSALVVEKDE